MMPKARKLNFRARILIGMLAAAFVSLSVFLAGSAHFAVRMTEKNHAQTVTGALEEQSREFDNTMREVYRAAVDAAWDAPLLQSIREYELLAEPAVEDAFAVHAALLELQEDAAAGDNIAVYLYEREQMISSNEYRITENVPAAEAPDWVTAEQTVLSPYLYFDQSGSVPRRQLCYFRDISGPDRGVQARVCVSVDERNLYHALFEQSSSNGSAAYLMTADGTVLSGTSSEPANVNFSELTGRELPQARTAFGTTTSGRLFGCVQGGFSGISVLLISSSTSLSDELMGMALLFLLLFCLVGVAAAFFAHAVTGWLYRPVSALMQAMEQVGQGDMTARAPVGEDEFGAIGAQFNRMMEQIDTLLDDLVEVRVEKRQTEIELLQQQIKPHFMYNTLNTIKFAAILQGNHEIGALLTSFIELLEASISKKGAFIPLSEEIRLVEDYAALQKYRYMDCFAVECRVEPEAAAHEVPRLLLQPLVENAILHGVDQRRSDNRIVIEATLEHDVLRITVADNGRGMEEAECRSLLEDDPDAARRFTGIGMRNVYERLRLYYGDAASFAIRTASGEGTTITLTLPAKAKEEQA